MYGPLCRCPKTSPAPAIACSEVSTPFRVEGRGLSVTTRFSILIGAVALVLVALPVEAVISGGGNAAKDCWAEFEAPNLGAQLPGRAQDFTGTALLRRRVRLRSRW